MFHFLQKAFCFILRKNHQIRFLNLLHTHIQIIFQLHLQFSLFQTLLVAIKLAIIIVVIIKVIALNFHIVLIINVVIINFAILFIGNELIQFEYLITI